MGASSPALKTEPSDLQTAYASLAAREGLLPVKVTPFYQKKIDEEVAALGGTHGPLYRAMYPVEERLYLRTPHELEDWVGDRANKVEEGAGFLIQKYVDRVLFLPTSQCASHCLYCFRQDLLAENKSLKKAPDLDEKLAILTAHLRARPATREVILSGGDPLMLPLASLEKIFAALRAVETVEEIRIHTRAPVFAPALLDDARKIKLFADNKVRFVLHIVHPYEVCEEVAAALVRLREAGIRLYNHFPLLRKINDHAEVLVALIRRLENLGVHTFSVYVPEPVRYSAVYRLSFRRACKLMDEVKASIPGWADFRFCLDTTAGKAGREHLIAADPASNRLAFMVEGTRVVYHDFPENLDEAGDIKTMLWKAGA